MDIRTVIGQLSVEEKAALVSGTDFMYTNAVPRLGIRSVRMSDGPHGLRVQKQNGDNGVAGSEPATAFPTAVTTASSWNPENTRRMGEAIARECRHYGVDVLLGPGTNIKRNPLAGRNFEYFSEDPLLAGKMAAAEVLGVQSGGVGVSVKHFALNNSENFRFMGDSVCDMRAIREIYLRPFEIVVKEGRPWTMMCAYNKVNGVYCCQNGWLLTDVLRSEWGFDGLVMTDWGATHDRLAMLRTGLDLEMPGDTDICRRWIIDAVKDGTLAMADLDRAVGNVLALIERSGCKGSVWKSDELEETAGCEGCVGKSDESGLGNVFKEHHELAAEIATDSAVLLKNSEINGCVLPLDKCGSFCVVGELFEKPRYQGAGSSMINPAFLSTPKTAFDRRGIKYVYAKGYRENQILVDESLISEALKVASGYDMVIVFAGLTDYVESEGCDRESMCLPDNQLFLINALVTAGKQVIVILYGGSPVELPFADSDNVVAILNMYLPGQNGGEAMASLVFGDKTPSGKLAETWPLHYDDVPFGKDFGKSVNEIYKESIFVGYRYYLTAERRVRYPFGYGLSYTSFAYRCMEVQEKGSEFEVSCTVSNTGKYDGAEVVQLYVSAPQCNGVLRSDGTLQSGVAQSGAAESRGTRSGVAESSVAQSVVFKPLRELKGFSKVYLKVGESKLVKITVKKDDLRYWNVKENRWVLEGGDYDFELCSDCLTVKLNKVVSLKGEQVAAPYSDVVNVIYKKADVNGISEQVFEQMSGLKIPAIPPKKPITLESRFTDMKQTFLGKILFNAVLSVAKKDMKEAKKLPEGAERDNKIKGALFLKRILESNSIITMSMSSGKNCPYNFAQGFVNLANGHVIRGIKCFCTKIRVPKLPKEKEENE